MPTKEQLHFMLQSDFEFGHISDRGSEHNVIGEHSLPSKRMNLKRPGKKVGEYRMVDGNLRFIPNK